MKSDEATLYNITTLIHGVRYALFDLATWKNGLAFKKIDFSASGVPIIKLAELSEMFSKSREPENEIRENLEAIGYGI